MFAHARCFNALQFVRACVWGRAGRYSFCWRLECSLDERCILTSMRVSRAYSVAVAASDITGKDLPIHHVSAEQRGLFLAEVRAEANVSHLLYRACLQFSRLCRNPV